MNAEHEVKNEICELKAEIKELTKNLNRLWSRSNRSRSRTRGRSHSRNRSRKNTPVNYEECWYHRKYERNSRKCRSPCKHRHKPEPGAGIHRLAIYDKKSAKTFLIDTGADLSVLPPDYQPAKPTTIKLYAANGTTIDTYGTKRLQLDLGLRRPYEWEFTLANVSQPIIGSDFIAHHDLLIDIKRGKLIDNLTKLESLCTSKRIAIASLKTFDVRTPYAKTLEEFADITRISPTVRETKSKVVHRIETTGQPVYARARRLDPTKLAAAKKEFEFLIKAGICRPSKSNWSSALHMVKKADNSWRPCGDYRPLNSQTIPDRYSIPFVQDCTAKLRGKRIFSKIDLHKAFHQVPIHADDIPKTAIITPFGLFEFAYMTFGLRNAAQTFQRLIDESLRGLDFVFAYIDDILIASGNEEEHSMHLRRVFQRLREFGLTINPAKCEFGVNQIKFLGHLITPEGIQALPEKVEAIVKFPKPTIAKQLKTFLATINFYRKFLPKAAEYQRILNEMIPGNKRNDKTPLKWSEEQELAFEKCKSEIAKTAILAHPDPDAELSLITDASNFAVGAALHQITDKGIQPIGFFSKKLTETEKKYSTYDRELLAIYKAIHHFRYMIEGRNVHIQTDHKPLTFAFKQKWDKASPRQQRHLDFIGQFTTDIRYIPGRDNVTADLLSRIEQVKSSINYDELAADQETDEELQQILKGNLKSSLNLKEFVIPGGVKKLVCDTSTNRIRPFITKRFRTAAMNSTHCLSHPGTRVTTKMISERYVWTNMRKDIALFVKTCHECQRNKVQRHTKSPLQRYELPDNRFSHINIDLVGPLPLCQGFRYCLTMIDRFTRWPEATPLTDISAETVTKAFISTWISRFGTPKILTTDQGRQFESHLMKRLYERLGTQHIRTTPYHPQANGIIERWHRTFKASLLSATSINDNWVDCLPLVMLGLRSSLKEDINCTPAQLVYGTNLRLPGEFFIEEQVNTTANELLRQLKATFDNLRPQQTTYHSTKPTFVNKTLETCTHAYVRDDSVRPSFTPPYEGPYEIIKRLRKAYILNKGDKRSTISLDRLKPAFLANSNLEPLIVESKAVTNRNSGRKNQSNEQAKQQRPGRKVKIAKYR